MTCLKIDAQFLDKNHYLIDSLKETEISADDKKLIDFELKNFKAANSDTAKTNCLSRLIDGVQNEKIWIKYNRLMYKIASDNLSHPTIFDSVFIGVKGLALNNIGYYYDTYSNRKDLALKYYKQGLDLNLQVLQYDNVVTGYSNLAGVVQANGEILNALNYYQKAISFEHKVRLKSTLFAPTNNLAQIYLYLGDTLMAINTLKKCFAMSVHSNNKFQKATLLQNIGLLSYRQKDNTGLATMKKALEIRRQIGDQRGLLQSYVSLAGIAIEEKNPSKAESYLNEASKIIGKVNYLKGEAIYYTTLGALKNIQNKNKDAILNTEKAVAVYKQISNGVDLLNDLKSLINFYGDDPAYANKKLKVYDEYLPLYIKNNLNNAQKVILKQKYDEDLKVNEAKFRLEQEFKEARNREEKHKQQLRLIAISVILFAVLIFSFFIYRALTVNKQKSKIISEQKIEVEKQKHLIEEKHKDITDSINYAQKIQSALIISEEKLNKNFKEAFVTFMPRDIVSGDFYWYSEYKGTKIIALADCTGHGVPGAFMSMIGITLLNQIVNEKGIVSPAQILNHLRKEIISALRLNSDGSDKRDGMDMAIISFNENELCYAGANSQAILIQDNQIIELKPDKQPIGIYEKLEDFNEQKIAIAQNLKVYLFSDGVVDQFGGPSGKKIKTRQFKEWLLSCSNLTLKEQKKQIEINLNNWKEGFEQTDDISLIGIKIS